MEFVTKNIGKKLYEELDNIASLKLVIAYFRPDRDFIEKLKKIPVLEIIVSDDFTITNPFILEELEKYAKIKYLPSDTSLGKLHSKVYYALRNNGSELIVITSANFTYSGMYSNCEASISIDSEFDKNNTVFTDFKKWNLMLNDRKHAIPIDYESAKRMFNNSQIHTSKSKRNEKEKTNYWILKTTSGGDINNDYWSKFKEEGVVALGWGEVLNCDPVNDNYEKVTNEIAKHYPTESAPKIYRKIQSFFSIKENDVIIIMRGFSPNQMSEVHLYGIAKVENHIPIDRESKWWIYKHKAEIIKIEAKFPKKMFTSSLEINSSLQAIHKINKRAYNSFIKKLKENYNYNINL